MTTHLLRLLCLAVLASGLKPADALAQPASFAHALAFDGVDDYVAIAPTNIPVPWTAALWVRREAAPGASAGLFVGADSALRLEQFNGTRQVGFTRFGVADYVFNYTAPEGVWTHLTFVAGVLGTVLYVNGAPVDTNANIVELPLARISGPAGDQLKGAIDEVTVWTVVRTPEEIAAGFNQRLTGNEPNLLLYYRLDSTTGTVAMNSAATGSAFSGALRFGPTWLIEGGPSPLATTLAATSVTHDFAVMNSSVDPKGLETDAWFEWGTTTNLGATIGRQSLGSFATPFAAGSTLLAGDTTYYYRVVASNLADVARGAITSFRTLAFQLDVNAPFPGVIYGSHAWGDYNNDGWLDVVIAGVSGTPLTQLWRNNGASFDNVTAAVAPGLPQVGYGSVTWTDCDNDGRLDLFVAGGEIAQLWRNLGNSFSNVTASVMPGLPGVSSSAAAWGDYDNDGRQDLLFMGHIGGNVGIAQLWRNTSAGFVEVPIPGLLGLYNGDVAWADYNNDGWLDFLITGEGGVSGATAELWRNTGSGFVNVPVAGLLGVKFSSVAWADYDNDGRLDFLIIGERLGGLDLRTQLCRNNGIGFDNVTDSRAPGVPGVAAGAVAWGDYDGDGWMDFLLTGRASSGRTTQLWRNNQGSFSNKPLPGLAEAQDSAATWADVDNDGRLDLFLTGGNQSGLVSQSWRNRTPAANARPAAPSGLAATYSNGGVQLTWNAATDAQTPANGLNYHVRIGTTPGGSEIASAMAAGSGLPRLPRIGAQRPARFRWVAGVNYNQPYYWSVQAMDGSFAGSPFAPEQSFSIAPPVVAPPGGLVPGDINRNGVVEEWELGAVLSHYFQTSPFLFITNSAGLGGTNVTFAVTNALAASISVEATTNLIDWEYVGPATPRYGFTDTNAPAIPNRSYRLRWP